MAPLSSLFASKAFVYALVIAIGTAVMAGAYLLLRTSAMRASPLRRRLQALTAEAAPDSGESHLFSAFRPLAPYLLPHREKERETIRLKLLRAGFPGEENVLNFYVLKVALIVVLPLATAGMLVLRTGLHPAYIAFFAFFAAFIGMVLPDFLLSQRVHARQREMLAALPDALDLLVSCTEAGLGLNGALQRVARQIVISSPLLSSELEQVNAEIRGGVDRIAALRNLTRRTGLEEMRGLVSLLAQSLRFGTPIAEILRVYADEFRDRRTQAAEEQAALVGTKLIFPLCFCIFPAFFIVSVGPAVIGVVRALAGTSMHF